MNNIKVCTTCGVNHGTRCDYPEDFPYIVDWINGNCDVCGDFDALTDYTHFGIPDSLTKEKESKTKPVLDVCCGGKMFYFDNENPLVEFCDIREEEHTLCDGRTYTVSPDTVCDFTNLPFSDESFNLVIFDPPHLINGGDTSWIVKKYGRLPKDYTHVLEQGFKECFRVLKCNGTLIFKWSECDIKVSEILKLTPEKPLLGHKSGKKSQTHWIVFYKSSK